MKTVGIIAEFNPFHKGHAYLAAEAKRITGADYCVAVMSGCFVQRGAPAVCDKYLRTEMALQGGVDAVFELPTPYATASAEIFAEAGIKLLDTLGVVDYLAFGSECGEIEPLLCLATILANEPADYKEALVAALKLGLSYPAARESALKKVLGEQNDTNCSKSGDDLISILGSPNNILAIEYLKAIIRTGSEIKPVTIKRIGSGYHDVINEAENAGRNASAPLDTNVIADTSIDTLKIASATGVRELIDKLNIGEDLKSEGICAMYAATKDLLLDILPAASSERILKELGKSLPVNIDALSDMLFIRLAGETEAALSNIMGVTPDLLNTIQSFKFEPISFSEMILKLKTKNLTYSAISRALLHIVLGTGNSFIDDLRASSTMPYARLLGFRKDASALLHDISDNPGCRLITKPSAGDRTDDLYMADIAAAQVYSQLVYREFEHRTRHEFSKGPIII